MLFEIALLHDNSGCSRRVTFGNTVNFTVIRSTTRI